MIRKKIVQIPSNLNKYFRKHRKNEENKCSHIFFQLWARFIESLPKFRFLWKINKNHFQHIRIRYTQLTNIRPNVFKHLPSLTTIDLRWNQLDHYDGSITLPKKVLKLYLSGEYINDLSQICFFFSINQWKKITLSQTENPYNCSNNFKWLLNQSKAKHIIDRNSLQCADSLFKNQSIQNVVNIKVVCLAQFFSVLFRTWRDLLQVFLFINYSHCVKCVKQTLSCEIVRVFCHIFHWT